MSLHPKNPKDLLLAPVAVQIDRNLERLRTGSARQVEAELELELDRPANPVDRGERVELVLRQALRNVELHGWSATITDDGSRVHLDGGSVFARRRPQLRYHTVHRTRAAVAASDAVAHQPALRPRPVVTDRPVREPGKAMERGG